LLLNSAILTASNAIESDHSFGDDECIVKAIESGGRGLPVTANGYQLQLK